MNFHDPASTAAQAEPVSALTPDRTPLIRFENVTKTFGSFTAISDLNLDIQEREFFSLLGPSGCGKTTMMRLLAGFEEVTSGRILLDGQDLTGIPANRRPVNMMFQSYALFPHMSVAKNIGFGLKQERWKKSDIQDRVDEMLALVQLEDFADRKPHQLSGGQMQRVALARSLAKKPKVLLLDEPLGALDKKLREETQFQLMDVQDRLGLTFIIVTHDQDEAMTVSSRIAVMKAGKLLQTDTPARIYEHPASSYVADFIGNVNLINVELAGMDGELALARWDGGTRLAIRPQPEDVLTPGARKTLVLRPEKIHVTKDQPAEAPNVNRVEGTVEEISYTGSASTFLVRLDGGQLIRAQEANRLLTSRREIDWNNRVWLSWRAGACVLVDA
ncbi:ABC transporter ATP-binding protein (plasmid) [Leisingera aquaemixtae]|uniref:ABC transporter ATP-binding protein n=1 Tax=Leisingera aquaemixtae TaxID=1396826 RepID=UPI0021A42CAA|nr:ABC transporter ATP-binding protein [Leisingera aquaemixtae]UWQ39419.1 ABC transporter ATP-binding protein [Leisingera aquaemixtae]